MTVTENIQQNLTSALYSLYSRYKDSPETLHYAISLVFASIFHKFDFPCIIVGGQSAAYWMHMPVSMDIDLVSSQVYQISSILESCGFHKSDGSSFRYIHPETNVLVELVGDKIEIAGLSDLAPDLVSIPEVDDPFVQSLMLGPAEILNPTLVFLNYLEASDQESIWHDYQDAGALAVERAQALFLLYKKHILNDLTTLKKTGKLPERLVKLLSERFEIEI